MHELQRSFTTPHSYRALEREIEMAEELLNMKGHHEHLESHIAAIRFVLGQQGSEIKEEYEALMSEQHGEAS